MKHIWLVSVALVLVACGSSSAKIGSLKQSVVGEKRAPLAAIEATYESAPWHRQSIEKVAVLLASAPHNASVFPVVAELMSRCSYQTLVLYAVAEAAARSSLELPEFADLAELAVLKLSGTQAVVDLANEASQITDTAEVPALREKIALLRAGADCQTVDEAIAKVATLLNDLDAAVKR